MDLLEDKSCSDITIKVEDKEYHLHKVVLRRCEYFLQKYFRTLFSSSFNESKSQVIILTDISKETFEQFLECIYTHAWNSKFHNNILQLYEFSLRMQYDSLSIHCLKASTTSIETFMELIVMNPLMLVNSSFYEYSFLNVDSRLVLDRLIDIDNTKAVASLLNNLENIDFLEMVSIIHNWCQKYKNDSLWTTTYSDKCKFKPSFVNDLYSLPYFVLDKGFVSNCLEILGNPGTYIATCLVELLQNGKVIFKYIQEETSRKDERRKFEEVIREDRAYLNNIVNIQCQVDKVDNNKITLKITSERSFSYMIWYEYNKGGILKSYRRYNCYSYTKLSE